MNSFPDETSLPPPTSGVELAPGVNAPHDAVRVQFSRSGGPGGQNVNKLNTKAELWVAVEAIQGLHERAKVRLRSLAGSRLTRGDEIHISAETARSQETNRIAAFERLRELILRAMVEPKVRRKTKPSKAAKQRRLDQKRRRGTTKSQRRGRIGED